HLVNPAALSLAATIFVVRIGATRLAFMPSRAWSASKKTAMSVSLCSVVSFSTLMVDNSLGMYYGLGGQAAEVMAALLGLNVLIAPGLTWWGLKIAGETHEESEFEQTGRTA
ncbi:MAG TPA: hypothetical protein VF861_14940, partial [Telluria sp.]